MCVPWSTLASWGMQPTPAPKQLMQQRYRQRRGRQLLHRHCRCYCSRIVGTLPERALQVCWLVGARLFSSRHWGLTITRRPQRLDAPCVHAPDVGSCAPCTCAASRTPTATGALRPPPAHRPGFSGPQPHAQVRERHMAVVESALAAGALGCAGVQGPGLRQSPPRHHPPRLARRCLISRAAGWGSSSRQRTVSQLGPWRPLSRCPGLQAGSGGGSMMQLGYGVIQEMCCSTRHSSYKAQANAAQPGPRQSRCLQRI